MKSELGTDDRLVEVAGVDELRAKGRLVVEVEGQKWALFYLGKGQVYCVADRCPHAGGSLGCGRVEGGQILCPRHGWRFDLKTGRCRSNPRFEVTARPVMVDGDRLLLRLRADQQG